MKTVLLQPIADANAGALLPGVQFPNDGAPHASKIDEGMPLHDGNVSRVDFTTALCGEVYEVSPLPSDFKSSIRVRIRAAAKSDNAVGNLGLILLINGALYTDPVIGGWNFPLLAPDVYHEVYFTVSEGLSGPMVTILPTDHLQLEVAGNASGDIISVTAIQLEIDYDNRPPTVFDGIDDPTTAFTAVPDPPAIVVD